MDLLPTPEQDEIVASVRAVLAGHHTVGEPLGDDLWHAAVEQGWFTLGVAESAGGVGYSIVEEVLLFRELGRAAVPGPFLSTSLAAHLAAAHGAAELVHDIAAGDARVALVERHGDIAWHALDAPGATHFLVIDDTTASVMPREVAAFLAEEPGFDPLTPLAIGVLAETTPIVSAPIDRSFQLSATVLTAAILAGLAAATTEQSVAYAKDRQQFGQPIGGFQAVKHRCADMAARAEIADTELVYAALAVRDGRADAGFHAHAARIVAAQAAITNSQVNIQNHGGIGFTWEHSAHRFVTRARIVANCLGTTFSHQAALLAEPAPL